MKDLQHKIRHIFRLVTKSSRKTLNLILLLLILAAIPFTVFVGQQAQDPRQRAAECIRTERKCEPIYEETCLRNNDQGECEEYGRQQTGEDCKDVCVEYASEPTQPPSDGGDGSGSDGGQSCNEDKRYCDNGTTIWKHGGYFDGKDCVYDYTREGPCGSDGQPAQPGGREGEPPPGSCTNGDYSRKCTGRGGGCGNGTGESEIFLCQGGSWERKNNECRDECASGQRGFFNEGQKPSPGAGGVSGPTQPPTGPGTVCQDGKTKERGSDTNPRARDGRCWTDLQESDQQAFQREYCANPTDHCAKAKEAWLAQANANYTPPVGGQTGQQPGTTSGPSIQQCGASSCGSGSVCAGGTCVPRPAAEVPGYCSGGKLHKPDGSVVNEPKCQSSPVEVRPASPDGMGSKIGQPCEQQIKCYDGSTKVTSGVFTDEGITCDAPDPRSQCPSLQGTPCVVGNACGTNTGTYRDNQGIDCSAQAPVCPSRPTGPSCDNDMHPKYREDENEACYLDYACADGIKTQYGTHCDPKERPAPQANQCPTQDSSENCSRGYNTYQVCTRTDNNCACTYWETKSCSDFRKAQPVCLEYTEEIESTTCGTHRVRGECQHAPGAIPREDGQGCYYNFTNEFNHKQCTFDCNGNNTGNCACLDH